MEYKIIHIDETDSTNGWLWRSMASDTPGYQSDANVVVVADYQTAGRGCGTNTWESERGRNLTFSVLIHPVEIPAVCQFRISEIVSLALCETLDSYLPDRRVTIKWPNDIYVDDRKICGMLIENRLKGRLITDSVIGIGLNVNQRVFLSDAPNPVSLYQLTGQETNRDALLNRFLEAFELGSQSNTTSIDYRERLFRKGKEGLYEDKTGRFTARLTDVLSDGRLQLVDSEGQTRIYAFKEVQFII
jgi:BirA family biotin operon repressor/biotin-[acetyl-CoA-carboxylase] ligase